jgi:hypothetical protein
VSARTQRGVAGVALVAAMFAGPVWPAHADAGCATAKGVYKQGTPWAQQLLDPQRIWPLSDGTGQIVAVIGTGVDAANTQFAPGQVLPGADLLPGAAAHASADSDCDGRGTFAAGLVGAQASPSTTFAGLAPGVRLLPVRYTQSTGGGAQAGDPARLATAIRTATAAHAGVILVVVPATADSARLRSAVADAIRGGAVVVSPAAAGQAGAHSYPTADPGVIGVGSVDAHGAAQQPETGALLAAPGANLVSTAPARTGHAWGVTDPQFAAAFVAGAAALLRAYRPELTPAQVVTRLTGTADHPATAGRDARLGWGVIDPYLALTSTRSVDAAASNAPAARPRRIGPAAAPARRSRPDRWPGVLAIIGLAAAATAGLAAAAVRRGWARRWQSGRI